MTVSINKTPLPYDESMTVNIEILLVDSIMKHNPAKI